MFSAASTKRGAEQQHLVRTLWHQAGPYAFLSGTSEGICHTMVLSGGEFLYIGVGGSTLYKVWSCSQARAFSVAAQLQDFSNVGGRNPKVKSPRLNLRSTQRCPPLPSTNCTKSRSWRSIVKTLRHQPPKEGLHGFSFVLRQPRRSLTGRGFTSWIPLCASMNWLLSGGAPTDVAKGVMTNRQRMEELTNGADLPTQGFEN